MLEKVIDQTSFLLGKQKESFRDCTAIFQDLLNTVETKLNKITDTKERETLEKVFDAVSGQAQKMAAYIQDDVDFLTEQLNAFNDIKKINDPAKAKEVLDMMLGEDAELDDTATFKKTVTEEAVLSKQNLLTVIQDLKETISEGNAEEVELFLQTLLDEENEDMDDDFEDEDDNEDDACCDDEEGECCDDEEAAPCVCGKGKDGKCTCPSKKAKQSASSCGSCTGCAGGGCGSGCGSSEKFDLFELLNEQEEETDKKLRSSDKKTGCC